VTGIGDDIAVTYRNGVLQIRHARVGRMAGTWNVQVTRSAVDRSTFPRVWALGGPQIYITEGAALAAEDAGGVEDRRLIRISGDPGMTFLHATIPPPRGATPSRTPIGEAVRDLMVKVRPSRLDNQAQPVAESDQRSIPVPVLSQMLTVPRTPSGASVLDLPMDVVGTDHRGGHFARGIRINLVRLRPLTEWRKEAAATTPKLVYTRGRIAEVQFRNGLVASLRLSRGAESREVHVASPTLGKYLAALDYAPLRGRTLGFDIRGGELHSVFRSLVNGQIWFIPGDHGIEGPAREAAPPRGEADRTDYPGATRFVQATSFRRGVTDRAINRIVIHITDGGASIEGPISWFQNPASGVSAHYVLGQNGEVVQMVRDRDIAWHANSANGDSIGIEHCARAPKAQGPDDPGLMPTPLQYAASGALVGWLCGEYGIPMDRDHILGHSEADPQTSHGGCPNAVWDWDYYMEMLTGQISLPPPGDETARTRREQPYFGNMPYVRIV
jgi:N-acetyl-anhydromuramyl-L-alanine amidase AmpD